jgi:hypothetical protein
MNPQSHLFLAACILLLLVTGGCSKRVSQAPVTSDEGGSEGPGERSSSIRPAGSADSSLSADGRLLSVDAGFSIIFPDKPREKFTSQEGLVTRTYSVEKDGHVLAAAVTQLADDVKKQLAGAALDAREPIMNAQFDRARDAAIGSGRSLSEQRLGFPNQFPDLVCDFQFEPAEGKADRRRLYLANDLLYAVIASGDRDFVTSAEADEFFKSFKLIDKSAQDPKNK